MASYNATRNGERVDAEPTGNVESHRGNHMAEFLVSPKDETAEERSESEFETDEGIDWAFVSEELADELGDS